ncbi:hypothetical protein ACET3Z_015803 [Daucus carota]
MCAPVNVTSQVVGCDNCSPSARPGEKISTKNNLSLNANSYDPQTTASYSGENSDPITIQFSGGHTVTM